MVNNDEDIVYLHNECVGDDTVYTDYIVSIKIGTIDKTEHKKYEIENDIDPEFHFYNNIKNKC